MKNLDEIFIASVGAQETSSAPASPPTKNPLGMFTPMILVFVIFYFLLIRPQSKQKKQHQLLLQNLKKGDDVVTTSGIYGKITGIADTILTLEIADNIRIKMDKHQVATVKPAAVAS